MATQNPASRVANPADFGRVAVVMGGSSSERAVSLDSGRNVLAALQARGGKKGVASLCIGGGEAVAMAVELA